MATTSCPVAAGLAALAVAEEAVQVQPARSGRRHLRRTSPSRGCRSGNCWISIRSGPVYTSAFVEARLSSRRRAHAPPAFPDRPEDAGDEQLGQAAYRGALLMSRCSVPTNLAEERREWTDVQPRPDAADGSRADRSHAVLALGHQGRVHYVTYAVMRYTSWSSPCCRPARRHPRLHCRALAPNNHPDLARRCWGLVDIRRSFTSASGACSSISCGPATLGRLLEPDMGARRSRLHPAAAMVSSGWRRASGSTGIGLGVVRPVCAMF